MWSPSTEPHTEHNYVITIHRAPYRTQLYGNHPQRPIQNAIMWSPSTQPHTEHSYMVTIHSSLYRTHLCGHNTRSPIQTEGLSTMLCVLISQTVCLWHCYFCTSAMQLWIDVKPSTPATTSNVSMYGTPHNPELQARVWINGTFVQQLPFPVLWQGAYWTRWVVLSVLHNEDNVKTAGTWKLTGPWRIRIIIIIIINNNNNNNNNYYYYY
jgi:hypothetical protein